MFQKNYYTVPLTSIPYPSCDLCSLLFPNTSFPLFSLLLKPDLNPQLFHTSSTPSLPKISLPLLFPSILFQPLTRLCNSFQLYNQSISAFLRMELNTSQKPSQNSIQSLTLSICLPFNIKPSSFRKSHRYQRDGHWNQKQRLKYAVFLAFFQTILADPVKKKRVRVYEMMSDMIITRNSNQCRSHHQKMEKYRTTIPDIISSVAEKYEPSIYQELSNRYLVLVKMLLDNMDKYKRTGEAAVQKAQLKGEDKGVLGQEMRDYQLEKKQSLPEVEVQNRHQGELNQESVVLQVAEQKKQEVKKTADDYSQAEGEADDEGQPVMLIDMKEEEGPDPDYRIPENPSPNQDLLDPIQPYNPNPLNPVTSHPGFMVDRQSQFYYQQQLMSLQLKKQWHTQNAEQLYSQWSNQVQNIKYCQQSITICKQVLSSIHNSNP